MRKFDMRRLKTVFQENSTRAFTTVLFLFYSLKYTNVDIYNKHIVCNIIKFSSYLYQAWP